MKTIKKGFITIASIIGFIVLTAVTVFAAENGTVEVNGNNKYPAFLLNQEAVYCAEIQNRVPENGAIYKEISVQQDFSCCNKIFIAAYLMNNSSVEYRQVIQQMIWGALNGYKPDGSIKKISPTAMSVYEEIIKVMDAIDTEDYNVTYHSYKTEGTSNGGTPYQMLIGAKVSEKPKETPKPVEPTPVKPEEPVPTEPTPEEPKVEITEPTEVPEVLPEEGDNEIQEPTGEPTEESYTLQEELNPKTGDEMHDIFLYSFLLILSVVIAYVTVKHSDKKKKAKQM